MRSLAYLRITPVAIAVGIATLASGSTASVASPGATHLTPNSYAGLAHTIDGTPQAPPVQERYKRWGAGLSVVGPSGIMALTVQHLPFRWLALEAGVLPAADLFSAWTGFRLRGPRLPLIRPFVGGFAHWSGAVDPGTGDSDSIAAVGPRVGFDMQFPGDKILLTVEADLAHPLGDDEPAFFLEKSGDWIGWGGMTISRLF